MAFDQGQKPRIACINQATVALGVDFAALVSALNHFVNGPFAEVWGAPADIVEASIIAQGDWAVVFLDDADQAGALGYHDVTCLTGDTPIPLLDGTTVALAELQGRDEFWVYSCDADNMVRPGHAHSVRQTGARVSLTEVALDDGSSIRCTADHRFMRRDGTFEKAENLRPGDSLMPLYRRRELIAKGAPDYEQVFIPALGEWRFTHRIVEPHCPQGWVRHHVNFNRFDNRPENLKLMPHADHLLTHQSREWTDEMRMATGKRIRTCWQNPELRARMWNGGFGGYNGTAKQRAAVLRQWQDESFRARFAAGQKKRWSQYVRKLQPERALQGSLEHRAKLSAALRGRPVSLAKRAAISESLMGRVRPDIAETARKNAQTAEGRALLVAKAEKGRHQRWHVNRDVIAADCGLCNNNHKVVSVHPCGTGDVYDLTIDGYHNLAVGSGVFVHNSDGLPLAKVFVKTTLAAGESVSVTASHEIFEMLLDPAINLCAVNSETIYAYELSDAVEETNFVFEGVTLSNFVYPAWFENFRSPNSARFDHLDEVTAPFQLLPGGYAIIFEDLQWKEIFGSRAKAARFAREDRRGHRSELRKSSFHHAS